MNKITDPDEQYDKIYRYCYFKVQNRELAEDITQETFLRFFESTGYVNRGQSLQYLYTIARHLCVDEYRRQKPEALNDEIADSYSEDMILTQISIQKALSELEEADRELLLLRYVNEVPVSVISRLYGISRFALYRRMSKAEKNLKARLGKEDFT